jgi:hypothetical protein
MKNRHRLDEINDVSKTCSQWSCSEETSDQDMPRSSAMFGSHPPLMTRVLPDIIVTEIHQHERMNVRNSKKAWSPLIKFPSLQGRLKSLAKCSRDKKKVTNVDTQRSYRTGFYHENASS